MESDEIVDSFDRLLAYPGPGKYLNAFPTSNHRTFRELRALGLLSDEDLEDLAAIARCVESDAGLTSNPQAFDDWLRLMAFMANGVGRADQA